jgi:hypothetical protein
MNTRAMGLLLLAVSAEASTPRNIGITTSAQTLLVNNCSTVVQVQTLDYAFAPAAVSTSTVLTPSGSFGFYSDSACTHSISTVTVTAGTSSAWFYFKPTISGTLTLQVSGGGFASASQSETSNDSTVPCPQPPPPTQCQNNVDAGVGSVDAGAGSPDGGVPLPQPCTDCPFGSSHAWMTEQQEVDWMNSLGFVTTVTSLHASYAHAPVYTSDPDPNVNHDTETDDLRNWYRLYKRTNPPYAQFLTNAQHWRNFYVNTYSFPNGGGTDRIEPEHIYLMGLIDWYLDHPSESDTLAAINRIIDFILTTGDVNKPFFETRVTARPIQCLAYYIDKMSNNPNVYRLSDVRAELDKLLNYVDSAHYYNGFLVMPKIYDGFACHKLSDEGITGVNLTSLFPGNATFPSGSANELVCADSVSYRRGGWDQGIAPGVAGNQDPIMMHALRVAARVLGRSHYTDVSSTIGAAWARDLINYEFWDTSHANNLATAYIAVVNAPQISMYVVRAGSSTPLYVTQFAAYHPNKQIRQRMQIQALMRQYGEYTVVLDSDVTGKEPKHYLSATWEQGYFLTPQ